MQVFVSAVPSRYDSTPRYAPEVLPQLCRVQPFYFEDSQVVLEASHNTISPHFLIAY